LTVHSTSLAARLVSWQYKGSLSMALALSLPTTLVGREQLIALVFGTVLLSLLASVCLGVKRLQLSLLGISSAD